MNKFTALTAAILVSCVIPMMATPSTSGVSGTATETTGGVYQQSVGFNDTLTVGSTVNLYSASFGSGGSQSATSSFSAQPINYCNGEDANGSATVSGQITVKGGIITTDNSIGSWAFGSTSNNGNVSVAEHGGNQPDPVSLSGSGSFTTSTSALIGTFSVGADSNFAPVNGAFAQSNTSGAFNFSASSNGGGWTGNGSTVQNGFSQTFNLGNGFSASSSASVISIACPVK